jgi:4a-hydroxytetrahydrobiopterin dehydratase
MNEPIGNEEIKAKLAGLKGWGWQSGKLVKSFLFGDFREAMSFLLRVSYEAEQRDHHPEIFNCYCEVKLLLSTHDAGGQVTEKDFALAKAIDSIA